jgi:Flp pilus assembly protein TadG
MKRLSNLRGQARPLLRGYLRVVSACGANKKAVSIGDRLRDFLCSGGEGQSLVEFAFVAPILLALMMGIYAVGIISFNDVALNNAVDIGASSLAVEGNAPGTNMVNYLADPCQYAFAQMTSATSNLIANNITVTYTLTFVSNGVTVTDNIGPFTGATANTCNSYSADFATGGSLTIVATYPCTLGLYGFNVPGCKLTASASQFIYTS